MVSTCPTHADNSANDYHCYDQCLCHLWVCAIILCVSTLTILIACAWLCVWGVDTQNTQLSKELESHKKEKKSLRSAGSVLREQLQTIQTQYAALQATHTEVEKDMVDVTAKYQSSMSDVLDLQRQLQAAQVYKSESVPLGWSCCVNTTSIEQY